jgi:membrane protease YdiL (CAAX protease family)
MTNTTSTQSNDQYSLAKILGIWAIVALPMLLITYVVAPALIPRVNLHPGILFWFLAILGMAWQFVVSMWIVHREEGDVRWATIRRRFWYTTPSDPKTGEPNAKLLWWSIPLILLSVGLGDMVLRGPLTAAILKLLPALTPPSYSDSSNLVSPEFVGQWWLLGVVLINNAFNYFLGEEFLFRGVLLPKMEGVFGKWDWVMNAVLFSAYHLHTPFAILGNIFITAPYIWACKYFRSNWFGVIVHGVGGVLGFVLVFLVVSGMAF